MSESLLSVAERLRAALHLTLVEDQYTRISIAELCRRAGVSRATLYQHHPELLREIRSQVQGIKKMVPKAAKSEVTRPILDLDAKALLYLCLEQQMEINSLKVLVARSNEKRKK